MKDNPKLTPKGKRAKAKSLMPRYEVEAETACALWEAMLDIRPDHKPLEACWEHNGTASMRRECVSLVKMADDIWNALPEDARDGWTWDWEFLPAFVARLQWDDKYGASNPFPTSDELALSLLLEYEARIGA